MAWPQIPSPSPVTVPARNEKTFGDLFVSGIRLRYLPGNGAHMAIGANNYDHASGEVLTADQPATGCVIQQLGAEMQRVPLLDTAVRQMVRASALMLHEHLLVTRIEELTREIRRLNREIARLEGQIDVADPEEVPVLEAQKAALEAERALLEDERALLPAQLDDVRTQLGIV